MYYFDDLVNHMAATGDTRRFSEVCPEFFSVCYRFMADADGILADRVFVENSPVEFSEVLVDGPIDRKGAHLFSAEGHLEWGRVIREDGTTIDTLGEHTFVIEAKLVHKNGKWVVAAAHYRPAENKS